MSSDPLVSIVCTAYKHEKFIKEALDGFLMQKTSFPYEVVVHDDASPDGTAAIIRDYAERFPDIIRPIFQTVNQFTREPGRVTRTVFAAAKGKYIALCEGDDYWTDPLKLQKQVDFLESHPLYSMCFHRAMLKKGDKLEPHPIPASVNLDDVRFTDLLETVNFIAHASVVYRNELMPLPAWFYKLPFGDLGLHLLNSRKGKIKCLDEFMSVYRITAQGAWSGLRKEEQQHRQLLFFRLVTPFLSPSEKKIMVRKRDALIDSLAHARYPVNPRRKRIYKAYLKYAKCFRP
ncbi:MAG: glycosyltransferase [Flavobacteriales bacterium]|nr:glycosyltransferase [Flavobacteriales bacterium]